MKIYFTVAPLKPGWRHLAQLTFSTSADQKVVVSDRRRIKKQNEYDQK